MCGRVQTRHRCRFGLLLAGFDERELGGGHGATAGASKQASKQMRSLSAITWPARGGGG